MLRRKLSKYLSYIVPSIESDEVAIMSPLQIRYIEYMMQHFKSNNAILYDFFNQYGIGKTSTYLGFTNIECSIGKRAYVPKSVNLRKDGVEIALYNWPTLIDQQKENIMVDTWINIPTYVSWFK